MKKSLFDIFDECSAQELDVVIDNFECDLPKNVSLDNLQSLVISKTSALNKMKVGFKKKRNIFISIAACVALFAAIGVGSYAYAAEIQEYNDAIKFFGNYELSTDGLSRDDIKKIYRDIKSESFSYSKTAELIEHNVSDFNVKGYDILQKENLEAEYIKSVWEQNYGENSEYGIYGEGDNYDFQTLYSVTQWITDEEGYESGYNDISSSYIKKYTDGIYQWTADFTEFSIDYYLTVDDGVLVYGETSWNSYEDPVRSWVSFIDNNGKLLWKKQLDSIYDNESIETVIYDDDVFTVFTKASNTIDSDEDYDIDEEYDKYIKNYMVIRKVDKEGNILSTTKTFIGSDTSVFNAAEYNNGYVVELYNSHKNDSRIVKVNFDGEIEKSFSFDSEDYEYNFQDMIVYNGKLYISADARPKELYSEVGVEGLGSLSYVKKKFTAVLLVCDFDKGTPQEFYSVKGSFASALDKNEKGDLLWETGSILSTEYTPRLSSHTYSGLLRSYLYTFDKSGKLISEEKTGVISEYRAH